MPYNFTDHEKRILQEAAERERGRMMTLRSSRTLRDLNNASPGAASDLRRAAEDSIFQRAPGSSKMQSQQIAADLKKIEAFRAGEVEPPPPTDIHPEVRAWLERRNRADAAAAAKRLAESEVPSGAPKHWPRRKSPFARFGC